MLGGSAPSQASGAPFRTDNEGRAAVWPPPAHQGDLFNRSYGIYSLFPGDNTKTLYTPNAKSAHSASPFQSFLGTSKVPDTFFSPKSFFGVNATSQFNLTTSPEVDSRFSRLDLTAKSFNQIGKNSSNEKPSDVVNVDKESKPKDPSGEVLFIKSEIDLKRTQGGDIKKGDHGEESGDLERRKVGMSRSVENDNESEAILAGGVLAREPDSTVCRMSDENQRPEDLSEADVSESIGTPSDVNVSKSFIIDGRTENENNSECDVRDVNNDKCNIRVIDLSVDGSGRNKGQAKGCAESDTCDLPANQIRCPKTKTPDSSCKSSSANCKPSGDKSKLPPTRTSSMSSNNGGCSRTTPISFRHLSQQERDPKFPNEHIAVSPFLIKKEPMDFHKYSNSSSFFSFTPLDNLFNHSTLRVLDGQLHNTVPYSDSYESSSRRKDNFLSPNNANSFLSTNSPFLSPHPVTDSPFLSPKIDLGEFGNNYKNYRNYPKLNEDYLMNFELPKIPNEVFLKTQNCSPNDQDRDVQRDGAVVNSTSETEMKNSSTRSGSRGSAHVTPCQVAEVTSASSLMNPKAPPINPLVIKQESASVASGSGTSSPSQKKDILFTPSGQSTAVSSTVGVSLTKQKCQQWHNEMKISLNNSSPPPALHRAAQSPTSMNLSPAMGTALYTGGMSYEERSATIWPIQTHNQPLWPYPAPLDYPPFPPVGFQLVRDPITGHFLLIPASNLEAFQRAILWPSYQPTPPQMIIPPISLQPSAPHLLLDTKVSAINFLSSDTIQHDALQHRILIATDNSSKRKLVGPAIIKLESSDGPNAVVATTCDNSSVYTRTQPLIVSSRTNVNFPQLSSNPSESVISQTTSPEPCGTPIVVNALDQSEPAETAVNNNKSKLFNTEPLRNPCITINGDVDLNKKGSQQSVASRKKFEPTNTGNAEQCLWMRASDETGTKGSFREMEDDKKAVLRDIQKRKETEVSLNIEISKEADVNIKKEIISPPQVDLSGLELLSNSIEQLMGESKSEKGDLAYIRSHGIDDERKDLSNDACEGAVLLQNLRNGFRKVEENDAFESENSKALGGLGLLCALAEQRFQEEIGGKLYSVDGSKVVQAHEQKEEREENSNDQKMNFSVDNQKSKDCDFNRNYQGEYSFCKIEKEEIKVNLKNSSESLVQHKKVKSESSVKVEDENSVMTDEIQAAKNLKRGPGRPKKGKPKKIIPHRRVIRKSKEMSPPVLEKQTDYSFEKEDDLCDSLREKSQTDISKPPTLTPSAILDPVCKALVVEPPEPPSREVNSTKQGQEKLESTTMNGSDVGISYSKKRKLVDVSNYQSSSKKRKVGRPKKHFSISGNQNPSTETIVAKKVKSKQKYVFSPTQEAGSKVNLSSTDDAMTSCKPICNGQNKKNPREILDVQSTQTVDDLNSEEKKFKKIRPKLKAEPKIKEWIVAFEDAQDDWNTKVTAEETHKEDTKDKGKGIISTNLTNANEEIGSKLPSCVLTTENLKSDKFPIRTLTVMGGLFYAGQLSAIRAPDVYGITIDGERGNRTHIYSREEILQDSILEVKPRKAGDLTPGTRCCAYWSEQYRCLYPGTISLPSSPDPELDDKFVNVEFDDGDSGRINIDDIRLLPEGYPIVEYDPNPLQSLSRRKQRISGTSIESHSNDRKSVDSLPGPEKIENENGKESESTEAINEETEPEKVLHINETVTFLSLESERKHLKKKRREKLKRLQSLSVESKKKHKKHRCSDEHRHHRHHKKHRKHKHKHGKRHGEEVNSETVLRESKADDGDISESKKVSKKKVKKKCKSDENRCNLSENSIVIKPKKCKERTESVESRSKMAAFLPARQLWGWAGKGFKRPGAKGRARKEFYKTIQRGKERITVGDCAVFLSTGRPDRPYIGRIESMWESWGTNMIVRVKWFYHPEETVGCPATLEYPGALFESPHVDENDVQTISHKCEVLPLKEYTAKIGNSPHRYEAIYDNNDIYYLAGYYDPTNTTLKMEPGVK